MAPSPKVATYDLQPEMSAPEVTENFVRAIEEGYDLIVTNYANPDMVGHTGNIEATIKAVEALDQLLGEVEQAVQSCGGAMLISADHGNAEKMRDEESGQPHTAHTSNPVALIYVGERELSLESGGSLADITPTMLDLMGLEQPVEMTGRSLITTCSSPTPEAETE